MGCEPAAALSGKRVLLAVSGACLVAAAGTLSHGLATGAALPLTVVASLASLGLGLAAGTLLACKSGRLPLRVARQMTDAADRQACRMEHVALLALDDGTAAYPGWHFETDRDGCIIHASDGLAAGLGLPAASLVGIYFSQLFAADAPGSGWHRLVLAVEAGHPVSCAAELPLHGGTGWWQVTVRPFLDRDGRPAGMRGVARDISRERAAQRQMADQLAITNRLSRRKSRFMAVIADELRSSVSTLAGFAGHLLSATAGHANAAFVRPHLETMQAGSHRLQNLVTILGDATRLEQGLLKLAEQEADAAEIAEIAVKMCRDAAIAAEVTLVATLIDGIELRCDVARIKQVLMGLITTAIAWSPAGGTVHVDFEHAVEDGALTIAITTEGAAPLGASPAELLDSYGSLAAAALELPIARQIALLHAGDVTMETTATGAVTFRLMFPASRIVAAAGEAKPMYSAA